MTIRPALFAFAGLALLAPAAAKADPQVSIRLGGDEPRVVFGSNAYDYDDLDRNDDGVISRWEWRSSRSSFDLLDRNNDGVLSRWEVSQGYSGYNTAYDDGYGRYRGNFRDLDRNDDGVVSTSAESSSSLNVAFPTKRTARTSRSPSSHRTSCAPARNGQRNRRASANTASRSGSLFAGMLIDA